MKIYFIFILSLFVVTLKLACCNPDDVEEICSQAPVVKYETGLWNHSKMRKIMLEKLLEHEKLQQISLIFLENIGTECTAVLIGLGHVVRLREGIGLCEELDQSNIFVKGFEEKKITKEFLCRNGLSICLPIRSYFLKAEENTGNREDYANLFILPKAKGKKLSDSLLYGTDIDLMDDIFYYVGYTLSLFQMSLSKDDGVNISTAGHGDLGMWNIFYDMNESKPNISWIDCTNMSLTNYTHLKDLGYLVAALENKYFECLDRHLVKNFQEKVLKGYCAGTSRDIIHKLNLLLSQSKAFKDEAVSLGKKIDDWGVDPNKILRFIQLQLSIHLSEEQPF